VLSRRRSAPSPAPPGGDFDRGAKGVLINITATRGSLKLQEVDAAAKIIEEAADPEDTIFGAVYDESAGDRIKITVIATGFNARAAGESLRVPT